MYGRFTFVIYVGGKECGAVFDRHMNNAEQLFATMSGLFHGARMFRKTASLYVYELNAQNQWRLCDSCGQRLGDNPPMQLDDSFVSQLESIKNKHK